MDGIPLSVELLFTCLSIVSSKFRGMLNRDLSDSKVVLLRSSLLMLPFALEKRGSDASLVAVLRIGVVGSSILYRLK